MAVAFDAASSSENVGVATSLTWSHTCASGASLGVGVAIADASLTPTCTYNGVSMTLEIRRTLPVDGDQVCLFKLENPASGAHDVVVSYGAVSTYFVAGAVSVTGADQTDCTSNSNSATGTSTTPSVTCNSASDELVMAAICAIADATSTAGTNETERWDRNAGASSLSGHGFTEPGASPDVTIAPTLSASSEWGIVAMSFKAAAGNIVSTLGVGVLNMLGRSLDRVEAMSNDARIVIGRA